MNTSAAVSHSVKLAIAVAAGAAVWKLNGIKTPGDMREIISTIAAVSGTLMGFMVAALSVLTAVINRRLVANLRKTGHYDLLIKELYYTALAYLATMVVAVTCLFLVDRWLPYGVVATSFCMVLGTLYFLSAGRKFTLVIRHIQ